MNQVPPNQDQKPQVQSVSMVDIPANEEGKIEITPENDGEL
ncbi:hypothetical protein ACFSDI_09490 [Evansella tamaricis]